MIPIRRCAVQESLYTQQHCSRDKNSPPLDLLPSLDPLVPMSSSLNHYVHGEISSRRPPFRAYGSWPSAEADGK